MKPNQNGPIRQQEAQKSCWTENLTFHANNLNTLPSLLTKTKHVPESPKRLSKVIRGTPKDT